MKIRMIGLVVVIALAGIYIIADLTVEKAASLEADREIVENYKAALAFSDAVVEVTTTGETKNVLHKRAGYNTGYTETKVIVNRIFENKKGNPSGGLAEGNNIIILEPTYTAGNGIAPGVTRFNYGEYTKMVGKATYVLFLKWDDTKDAYWINALEQGKFNLDRKDASEAALASESTQYAALRQDVLATLYP